MLSGKKSEHNYLVWMATLGFCGVNVRKQELVTVNLLYRETCKTLTFLLSKKLIWLLP
jgi:hypothetical protein